MRLPLDAALSSSSSLPAASFLLSLVSGKDFPLLIRTHNERLALSKKKNSKNSELRLNSGLTSSLAV